MNVTANDSKSTPKKAEDALADLQRYAESAAAARLGQMHGHLSTNHRASGYDGTAAQIHTQYAQALAPIVEALRAQAEAEAGLREALDAAIQCETDVLDVYQRRTSLQTLDLAVAELKRDSLPKLKAARVALAQAGGEG